MKYTQQKYGDTHNYDGISIGEESPETLATGVPVLLQCACLPVSLVLILTETAQHTKYPLYDGLLDTYNM